MSLSPEDRQLATEMLKTLADLQTKFWEAANELERHLSDCGVEVDIDTRSDLAGLDVDDLIVADDDDEDQEGEENEEGETHG